MDDLQTSFGSVPVGNLTYNLLDAQIASGSATLTFALPADANPALVNGLVTYFEGKLSAGIGFPDDTPAFSDLTTGTTYSFSGTSDVIASRTEQGLAISFQFASATPSFQGELVGTPMPFGTVTVTGANGQTDAIGISPSSRGLGVAEGFASSQAQIVTQSGSASYAPGSSFLAVANNLGTIAVLGPSTTSELLVGDGSTLAYFGNADANIVSGNGNDTIVAGAGNDTIDPGIGANLVVLGSGNSEVYSTGTDRISAGSGRDTVDVFGVGTSVTGGSGGLLVNDSGTGTQILGGAGVRFVGNTDTATITGGTGADTVSAASSSIKLENDVHNNVLVANQGGGTGSSLLDGSGASGGNQFWAGAQNATLIGGAGNDTLVGGTGASTLTGGGGSNTFDLFNTLQAGFTSGANTEITDFGASSGNVLTLFDFGQNPIASQQVENGNTVITLSTRQTITLDGVTHLNPSQLLTFTNPTT